MHYKQKKGLNQIQQIQQMDNYSQAKINKEKQKDFWKKGEYKQLEKSWQLIRSSILIFKNSGSCKDLTCTTKQCRQTVTQLGKLLLINTYDLPKTTSAITLINYDKNKEKLIQGFRFDLQRHDGNNAVLALQENKTTGKTQGKNTNLLTIIVDLTKGNEFKVKLKLLGIFLQVMDEEPVKQSKPICLDIKL